MRLNLERLESRLVPALIGPELLNPYDVPTTPPITVVSPEPAYIIVTPILPGYTPMPAGPVATSPSIINYTLQPIDWPSGTVPIAPIGSR